MSERPEPPQGEELAALLGPAHGLWTDLLEAIGGRHAPVAERWVWGGTKYGWSCRLERGKKGILYLTPAAGSFRVGLALSAAAREAALAEDLPTQIHESLLASSKAMEGWPIRMTVTTPDDVAMASRLASIKLSF